MTTISVRRRGPMAMRGERDEADRGNDKPLRHDVWRGAALKRAHDRDRTGDLILTKDVLCRLSYVSDLHRTPKGPDGEDNRSGRPIQGGSAAVPSVSCCRARLSAYMASSARRCRVAMDAGYSGNQVADPTLATSA